MQMNTLLCPACETTYSTATTGPRLERLAQLGCEACGAPEPLRAAVSAIPAPVNALKVVAHEEHEASARSSRPNHRTRAATR